MIAWVPVTERELQLQRDGEPLASVYPLSGHWHTWDADGVGGENDTAPTVDEAKNRAVAALYRQEAEPIKGWQRHGLEDGELAIALG